MAAIGPNVGEQAAQEERAPVVCRKDVVEDLKGLGHSDQTANVLACAPPLEVSHAGLTRFVWVRRLFEEALTKRSYHIEKKAKEYHFVLSEAIPKDLIPWHAQGSHVQRMNLLSENGKMATKSWDLPAGALEVGGACPGAKTGQSIVPAQKRQGAKAQLKIIQDVSGRPHDLAASICEMCYATDGRYSSVAVQVAEILRYHWARESLKTTEGRKEFTDILVACINGAEIKESRHKRADGKPIRPFRIHSSGDFYDQTYADVWIDIMNACPDITFWAPTRTWVVPGWVDYWKSVYGGKLKQPNFSLRVSAFHTGDKAPEFAGLPKGSAVIYEPYVEKTRGTHFDYVCEAYAVDDPKHSCDMAKAPDGEKGCRACWAKPELAVCYVAH